MGEILKLVSERQRKNKNTSIEALESEFAKEYKSEVLKKYLGILVDIRTLNRIDEDGIELYNLGFMVG